jgi:hypothetical protein
MSWWLIAIIVVCSVMFGAVCMYFGLMLYLSKGLRQ